MRRLLLLSLTCVFCSLSLVGGEDAPATTETDSTAPFSPATTQYDFARGLLARNLYAEAAAEFTSFLKTYPQDPRIGEATLWRGEAFYAQAKFKEASVDFYAILTKHKDLKEKQAFARLRYGCCLFELNLYPQAVSTLAPLARQEDGDDALIQTAQYYLGLSHAGLKQYPQALAALEQVTAGPLAPDAVYEQAEVKVAQGAHDEAAKIFLEFYKNHSAHPRAANAMIRRGEELRVAGKLDAAAESYLELIQSTRDDATRARARYGLAWVRYTQGNYTAARDLTGSVISADKGVSVDDARYLHGLAALRLREYKSAENAFAAVTSGQYARAASVKRAWTHLAAGDGVSALKAVEETIRQFPDMPRAELDYVAGKAFVLRKDYARAIERLKAARDAKDAYHAEAALDLANTYARIRDGKDGRMLNPGEAAEAYAFFVKTFPRHPRVVEALAQQGNALVAMRDYVKAVPVYEMVLSRENAPDDLREHALAQQAVCYYHLKQFANMKRVYERLYKEFPKGKAAAEALYWLAWYEHREKHFGKAEQMYEQLLKTFPASPFASRARYRRAMSLYQDGQEQEAADALYTIVTKYPQIPLDQKELLWLGQFYMNRNSFKKSDAVYEALLTSKPDREARALAFYYQAESRRRRKEWDSALKRYDRLLGEKDTGLESAAQFGRAVCLRRLGKLEEARDALAKVKLTPDDPLVARYYAEIGHLDYSQKKYKSAAANLMRVGLLYDEEELCGEALYTAGLASLADGNRKKALICFRELAGDIEGGYGTRYPKSEYARKGKAKLDELRGTTSGPEVD